MQAIETKWLGPTNHRGSRVKATCQAGSVTVGWDYGAGNDTGQSDVEANHDRAARALIQKMGWFGTWARGAKVDDTGYAYVCLLREFEGRAFRTPHPQAARPLDLVIVRMPKGGGKS